MNSECDCVKRFRNIVENRRSEAKKLLESELPQRLEVFAEAMRLGVIQIVARSLLRAAVFRASLDLDGSTNLSTENMLNAVKRVVMPRPKLKKFLETHWDIVVEQANYVNPKEVLPKKKILSRKSLSETFGGHIDSNLDAAEKSLTQLEILSGRLPGWKSSVRGADVPRVEVIMDYHESLK